MYRGIDVLPIAILSTSNDDASNITRKIHRVNLGGCAVVSCCLGRMVVHRKRERIAKFGKCEGVSGVSLESVGSGYISADW